MTVILRKITREPNAVTGLVIAVLALLVAFGVHLNHEQDVAVLGVIAAAVTLLRFLVTPSAEVVAQQRPGDVPRAGPAASVDADTPVAVVLPPADPGDTPVAVPPPVQ